MSILLDNFSIGADEWAIVTDLTSLAIDVVDLSCAISTSGTYFLLDGDTRTTSFSPITNGYRASCSIPVLSGTTVVTIHAENTCSGITEEDYTLMFGYNVVFEEYVDWGPNKFVDILTFVDNEVDCPNTESYSTYFQTKDLDSVNLGAVILPAGWSELGASITPQGTYLEYGRTYTIKIENVKDFSGNVLDTVEYTFTVVDS